MLNILPSIDNETVLELKKKLFEDDTHLGLSYILYDGGHEVGLAEMTVNDTSVIHRLGVLDVLDKALIEDFFIRSLLYRLLSVCSNIEISFVREEYLQFGFKIKYNKLTAPTDKIIFPSDCKG